LEEEVMKSKSGTEFYVGDHVRIRRWYDLEKEYGTDSDGDINPDDSNYYFDANMKPLCGRFATVKSVDESDDTVLLHEWSDDEDTEDWNYEFYMLEPAFKVGDRVRFRSWDDMKEEYGLDCDGDIPVKYNFTTGMKSLCGNCVTIETIDYCSGMIALKDGCKTYRYSYDMFEKISEDNFNQHVIITKLNNKTTLARVFKDGKEISSGTATKADKDGYSFSTGAIIACCRACNIREDTISQIYKILTTGTYNDLLRSTKTSNSYFQPRGTRYIVESGILMNNAKTIAWGDDGKYRKINDPEVLLHAFTSFSEIKTVYPDCFVQDVDDKATQKIEFVVASLQEALKELKEKPYKE